MGNTLSFAGRALLAFGLLVGFYTLALGTAFALAYIPYAEVVYGRRLHIKLALGCLAASFAILKGSVFLRAPPFEPPGPEVTEEEQPRLFAVIREVAEAMNTRMPAQVFLFADVNAFVEHVGGFMGFGAKRVLGIGVGLLAVDSVSELKATLAHEFGHYAAGDTRLAGLVYRTRASIGCVLEGLGDSWLSAPFESYGHMFLRVTYAVSRAQELEADRASVAVAGKDAHIRGLEREARAAVLFEHFLQEEVMPVFAAGYRPSTLFDGFRAYSDELERRGTLPIIDDALRALPTSTFDTHPALPERIAFARALDCGPSGTDDTSALDLLDHAASVEDAIIAEVAAERLPYPRALTRVAWSNVAQHVLTPRFAREASDASAALARALGSDGSVASVLRAVFLARDEGRIREAAQALDARAWAFPPEQCDALSLDVVYNHVAVVFGAALVDRGGAWEHALGRPYAVQLGDERIDPFALTARALVDASTRAELLARLEPRAPRPSEADPHES